MFDYRLRSSADEIGEQARDILADFNFSTLLADIPNMIIILNHNRQIVYMNRKFSMNVGKSGKAVSSEKRPGECLLCVHAINSEYGCGSTDFCKVCGFANAIGKSEQGKSATGECNITLEAGETMTFRVHTRPFIHKGKNYVFAYMQDISDYKTRQMLENIFLHDINNSITSLNGLSELMDELPDKEVKAVVNELSTRLTDEIQSYRLITEAESHQLSVTVSEVSIDALIDSVAGSLLKTRFFRNRKVSYEKTKLVTFTDETLLRRVLINALKNALEASDDDQEVTITAGEGSMPGDVDISVRSVPLIPREVQLQLFQRSFSTKGPGRGWGTYSIRLLTERYLSGKVSFVSDRDIGTVFTISIPSLNHI